MKKLAIVGTALSSRDLAPYDNDEYELWGLNGLYTCVPFKFSRWFEMHSMEYVKNHPEYHKWLSQCPVPVYMQDTHGTIPTSVKYPKEEILNTFRRYFTSTISWMLALAIYEGYKHISVYGVDMALDSEYSIQKPSCEYFLGYCEGKGIELFIPEESDLLKASCLYGYERSGLKNKFTNRVKELDKRLLSITQQEEALLIQHGYLNLVKEKAYLLGCRDDTQYYIKQIIPT